MVTKPETVTPSEPGAVCANCGAPLYGEYCYACGQPVKGLIRHLSGVLGDVLDTVLNIDSRVIRTLPALYFRPGFLTREYFAGRRMRYVTPFRLMFFLALAAFFVMQLAVDTSSLGAIGNDTSTSGFAQARTPAEVAAREKQALDKLDATMTRPGMPAAARGGLETARKQVQRAAADRLKELQKSHPATPASASSGGQPSGASKAAGDTNDNPDEDAAFGGWNPSKTPLHVTWWPDFANQWLNNAVLRARGNLNALRRGTPDSKRAALRRMIAGALSLLPQTMFVLLPLFALILKVFYIFKRRLYMEHLIVALHSHAFIFLSLLLIVALGALKALAPNAAWIFVPLDLLAAAVWIWLFLYLWLMQKRVYGQGWFFTTVKYGCVGICYTVLLSFAVSIAFALSLAQA